MMHSGVRRGVALAELLATVVTVAVLLTLLLPASQRSSDGFVNRGGGDLPTPIAVVPVPPPTLAVVLEEIIQTGEVGSRVQSLRVAIQQVSQDDPDKGAALAEDLIRLEAATDSEDITALASGMAAKL